MPSDQQSILIRETIPDDQQALEQLMTALNRHEFSYAKDREIMGDAGGKHMRYLQERVQVDGGLIYVAECGDDLAGFILVLFEEIDGHYVREALRPYALVSDLYVKKDYRKQGLGKKLLEMAETKAKLYGYEKIRLNLLYGNKEAMKFYQALGYKVGTLELEKDV